MAPGDEAFRCRRQDHRATRWLIAWLGSAPQRDGRSLQSASAAPDDEEAVGDPEARAEP